MSGADPFVVVPVLNEAGAIATLVGRLCEAGLRVVVVDGGSVDGTVELARNAGAEELSAPRGRAVQLAAGAVHAAGQGATRLLFLHADVHPPAMLARQLRAAATAPWARFDVSIPASGARGVALHVVAWFMNRRSRLTGICTGDQGLLVDVALYRRVGGYAADLPLMEDIDISRRLKAAAGRPARLAGPLAVSPRRWLRDGVVRTVCRMWAWRLRYFLGTPADQLAREYYPGLVETGNRAAGQGRCPKR